MVALFSRPERGDGGVTKSGCGPLPTRSRQRSVWPRSLGDAMFEQRWFTRGGASSAKRAANRCPMSCRCSGSPNWR